MGLIIGPAFGRIVSSFVGDLLIPPIGLLLGKASGDSTTRPCPLCLSNIPFEATRCAHCASEVKPA